MTAFDTAWAIVKDFRFDAGFPGLIQQGGYDPKTDTPYVNLASRVSGYEGMDNDEDRIKQVLQTLSHEHMHQALHPPYTDDLWNEVSMFGLDPNEVDEDEKRRLQAKIDEDWQRFQEYGAWTGTQGIDDDEKWRMLALYGIYPKNAA